MELTHAFLRNIRKEYRDSAGLTGYEEDALSQHLLTAIELVKGGHKHEAKSHLEINGIRIDQLAELRAITMSHLKHASRLVSGGRLDEALRYCMAHNVDFDKLVEDRSPAKIRAGKKGGGPKKRMAVDWAQIVRILVFQQLSKGRRLTPEQVETFNQYCMPRSKDA